MRLSDFKDSWNLLSGVTGRKLLNAAKVFASYYYSRWYRKAIHKGLPVSIAIEPTTSCNLRCPQCPSGLRSFTRETGMINEDFFKTTIDALYKELWYLTFYFQGEPYLHPDFTKMVAYASAKGIYTATSTNAHFLNDENAKKTVESGLDRLIISIDGATQEAYEAYRIGGSLDKVLEGTRNIIKWKRQLRSKTPRVIFQFLVLSKNEQQMSEVEQLGARMGVDDVWFKTAQVYDYENGHELLPVNEKFSRYRKNSSGHYVLKNELLNHCWKQWQSCVITWDGKVVPCCFDKDAVHQLGDLKKEPFQSIWKGEKYQQFRGALLKSRKEIDICSNCSEGTVVWGS